MPKRSSKKEPEDVNEPAKPIVDEATSEDKSDEPEKTPAAVALGRLGGKKGGPARAKTLSREERSRIAKRAAEARWKKARKR